MCFWHFSLTKYSKDIFLYDGLKIGSDIADENIPLRLRQLSIVHCRPCKIIASFSRWAIGWFSSVELLGDDRDDRDPGDDAEKASFAVSRSRVRESDTYPADRNPFDSLQ